MKNWKKITGLNNEFIRTAIIQASEEDSERLSLAYPECFADDDTRLSRTEFLDLIRNGGQIDKIASDQGILVKKFSFSGSFRGTSEEIPSEVGNYKTQMYGWLQYFPRFTKEVGEDVEFQGAKWIVVRNYVSHGDAMNPSDHRITIVPAETFQ